MMPIEFHSSKAILPNEMLKYQQKIRLLME
jgi:hypothetical protein